MLIRHGSLALQCRLPIIRINPQGLVNRLNSFHPLSKPIGINTCRSQMDAMGMFEFVGKPEERMSRPRHFITPISTEGHGAQAASDNGLSSLKQFMLHIPTRNVTRRIFSIHP